MDKTTLWNSVLSLLESKLSKANFLTWFQGTKIQKKKGEEIYLSVPNIFVKEWLKKKFEKELLASFQKFSPEIKKIRYVIEKKKTKIQTQPSLDLSQPQIEFLVHRESGLSPKYTFKNFVIGSFNQLAAACAISIAKRLKLSSSLFSPQSYNPFFVYSDVGLGKTHLLEAIGNEVLKAKRRKKVKYIPCSSFTSQVISAIRDQNIEKVVEEYQNFDLLIIDDIEFLAGKERTQEVFFRIFNELLERGSQIVLSSDRPPHALEKIEERLRSRFKGGMVADISQPSFEERVAILQQKIEERNVILPKEIIEFIAQNVRKNIRELEGALIKAIIIFERDQSIESVKKHLQDLIEEPRRKITVEKIINEVCEFYNVSKKEILSKSRKKEYVLPRQVIMYLLREELNLSLPSIGVKLGNKDHTTVGYACEKIREKLRKDGEFIKDFQVIKERIYNS